MQLPTVQSGCASPRYESSSPQRLATKVRALQTLLDYDVIRRDADLHSLKKYCEIAIAHVRSPVRDDERLAAGDHQHIQLFCQVENQRKPGLNLLYGGDELLSASGKLDRTAIRNLVAGLQRRQRIIVIPYQSDPAHRVLIVVMQASDADSSSAVVFESVPGGDVLNLASALSDGGYAVDLIGTRSQSSKIDCVLFSLAHAMKAHTSSFIAELHQRIRQGPRDFQVVDPDSALPRRMQTLHSSDHSLFYSCANKVFSVPFEHIPAIFKKHTKSSRFFSEQTHDRVNGEKHAKPATLSQRMKAFETPCKNGSKDKYHASIAGFRLQEICRVLQLTRTAFKRPL